MRADRLISVLLLLQVHRRMTARDLAGRLEVSERTIHRDMEALGVAGVPVFAERGSGGGWALMDGYRTNLTGLTSDEVQALFLSRPPRVLADLGLEKASDAGLIKLLAAVPSVHRDYAEYARQRIHIDTTGWNRSEESVQLLPTVQQAVLQDRKLRFVYERGDCDPVERLVDPLGLVAKGSAWYLVAAVDGDIRSYRVSRIKSADVMDEACTRPSEFDLATFWRRSAASFKENFPRYYATVRADAAIIPRMSYAGRFARVESVEPPDSDGWSKVRMRFQFDWEAAEYVLGFGPRMEAVEPESLRQRVIQSAEDVIAFYAGRDRTHKKL